MMTKRDVIVLGRALGRAGKGMNSEESRERWESLIIDVRLGIVPTNRIKLFNDLIVNPERPL